MTIHYFSDPNDIVLVTNLTFLIMKYMRVVLFTVVFYYFTDEASKIEFILDSKKWFGLPVFAFSFFFLIFSLILFFIDIEPASENPYGCQKSIYLYLAAIELFLTSVFITVGIFLGIKIRVLRMYSFIDTTHMKELW